MRGSPPVSRYYHSACVVKGAVLIYGGNDGVASLGDVFTMNTESWTWAQPATSGHAPLARYGHAGVLCNKLLFIIGGLSHTSASSPPTELRDVHVLDTESWSWWAPELPCPPARPRTRARSGPRAAPAAR